MGWASTLFHLPAFFPRQEASMSPTVPWPRSRLTATGHKLAIPPFEWRPWFSLSFIFFSTRSGRQNRPPDSPPRLLLYLAAAAIFFSTTTVNLLSCFLAPTLFCSHSVFSSPPSPSPPPPPYLLSNALETLPGVRGPLPFSRIPCVWFMFSS